MHHKIAAIVLNFRKPKDTIDCVMAMLSSDGGREVDYNIVDNSPEDSAGREFKKQFPKINYIRSRKNLGFAGGNNQAIRRILSSKSEYVLIINPDVRVGKKFFLPLAEALAKDPQAGVVAPAIRHEQNGVTFFGLQGTVDWTTAKASHLNLRALPETRRVVRAEFVTFACVLIKADVFRKVGLLDEGYFMYLEDVDYCLRVKNSGWRILLDEKVVVDHQTSSSFKKPTDKLAISFRSQLRFIHKWWPFPKNVAPFIHALLLYPYLYCLWTYHYYKRRLFRPER